MTETVLASSECADVYRVQVALKAPISAGSLHIEAGLWNRKAPTSTRLNLLESISLVVHAHSFELVFTKEIREIGFWSLLTVLIRPCSPEASAADLVGRFTLPVFNKAGVLLSGQYLVFGDVLNETSETLLPTNAHFLGTCLVNKSDYENMIENFHANLEQDIIQEKLQAQNECFAIFDIASTSYAPVVFSSECSKTLLGRQVSSSDYQFVRTMSGDPIRSAPEGSVLTNWMVVNGPIDSRGPGIVSGTGFVGDLHACMSPSPIQIVDYELFKEHPAATKANRIQRFSAHRGLFASSSPLPNADEMSLLNDIILQPMRDLSVSERELLLKFMWSLTTKKQALLKVILVAVEAVESMGQVSEPLVTRILATWTPVDVDGALALLGEEVGKLACSVIVRKYAVNRLAAVD
jgi:hypothetical protein